MPIGRWGKPSVDDEVDHELAFHLEARTAELMAQGLTSDAARREAERRLGDVPRIQRRLRRLGRERDRAMHRTEWFTEFRQDVTYAVRHLVADPGFSLIALLTLAIGIGATTAIFSAVYSVVLKPLPFPEPDRVVVMEERYRDGATSVSVGNYSDLKRETRSFQSLGAIYWSSFNYTGGDLPERVLGGRVTADYFRVFQVAPVHGRVFTEEEDRSGGAPVVVLSHRFWTRRFGADPRVVGRVLLLNAVPHTVVGVMPARFDFTATSEEVWVPAGFTATQVAQHDEHYLTVYGRLKAGVGPEAALSDLNRTMVRLQGLYPIDNSDRLVAIASMFDRFVGEARVQLLVVLGAVSLVLLIGCVNVANLLLARGAARTKELALRAALGAGRGRIVRQLMTESLVLGAVAGTLGIAIAYGALRALIRASPAGVPRLEQAAIDLPTLLFAVIASLGSALLFGLIPATRTARPDLARTLRDGGRGASSTSHEWTRRGLVAAEVAGALILLVGAGLLIRTAIYLQRIDPGFDPHGVLSAMVALPKDQYLEWDKVTETYMRMTDELRRIPGVTDAAVSSQVPMGPGGNSNGLVPEGRTLEIASAIQSQLRLVSPGYFGTMRIPLQSGRDFTLDDRIGNPRVMIVSESFAKVAWPNQNPIGKRVACCEGTPAGPMWKEVVAVAGDVRADGPGREAPPEFYLPIRQAPKEAWEWLQRSMNLVVRGRGDVATLTAGVRSTIKSIDPGLPVFNISLMNERLARAMAQARFNTVLLSLLGGIGLLLSAIGIYGVIAYFVTRRTREIGIRLALGASHSRILAMVMRQGMGPVILGVGIGVVGAVAATRALASQLRGISPQDPITFGLVAVVLIAVALAATLIPARRALRVDTLEAIREE